MFMVNNTDIIICVHNGLSLVKECLEAAAANSGNCRLIIVDDNSHKATKDYLISFSLRSFFIDYPHRVKIILVKTVLERMTAMYEYATARVVNRPTPTAPPWVKNP